MKYKINCQVFEHFPELESKRLIFRRMNVDDADVMLELRSCEAVMQYMDREGMKSITESESLLRSIQESFVKGQGISWGIVEKVRMRFIGYFGFWRIDACHCRGEIGYALHPDYWRRGYMYEAIRTLIDFGFKELKLHSIEANVNPDNLPSIALLEKIGFRREAYFRENFLFRDQFKDSVIYSLLERDLQTDRGRPASRW